jgi:hypothetical protein
MNSVAIWKEEGGRYFPAGWYFKVNKEGETGLRAYGPYPSEEEARIDAKDFMEKSDD